MSSVIRILPGWDKELKTLAYVNLRDTSTVRFIWTTFLPYDP